MRFNNNNIAARLRQFKEKNGNNKLELNEENKQIIRNMKHASKRLLKQNEYLGLSKDRAYTALHHSNQKFLKTFSLLSSTRNKEREYKKAFIDVITKYQDKQYKIPKLSLENNIFNPSILLLDSNELEEHYKYHPYKTEDNNIKVKDKGKAYMYRVNKGVNAWKFFHVTGSDKMINELKEEEENIEDHQRLKTYETPTKKKSRFNNKEYERYDLFKERRQLMSAIRVTNKSINKCESSTISRFKIPRIPLSAKKESVKLDEDKDKDKANQTMSTIQNSTRYTNKSISKFKQRIHSYFDVEENLRQAKSKTKTLIHPSSRNNTKNDVLMRYYSDNIHNDSKLNKNDLTSKEDFCNFFLKLKENELSQYDMNNIANAFMKNCLSKKHKIEFEKLYNNAGDPKSLLYIIKNFQKISKDFNVSQNYPIKIPIKPIIKTERTLDNYTSKFDTKFKRSLIERTLSN